MAPLLERGRAAIVAYVNSLPESMQPLGGTRSVEKMDVITAADFDASPRLVRRHCVRNKVLVTILCESGGLCSMMAPRLLEHW